MGGYEGERDGQRAARGKSAPGSGSDRPFISYVATSHEDEEEDPDGLSHQQRMALEEKAIQHILSLEPQLERTPTNNPGFDLTEQDADAETVRWIEVKAMTGSLRDRPATMSHTQFQCAQACAEAYWLYVVEQRMTNQGSSGRRSRRQGAYVLFDRGWLAVAEFDVDGEEDRDGSQNPHAS